MKLLRLKVLFISTNLLACILNIFYNTKYLNFLNSSGEIKFFLQKITHVFFYTDFCLFITAY